MVKKHKSVPIKKVKSGSPEHKHPSKSQQGAPVFWIGLSFILSLALIVSISMNLYGRNKIDVAISNVNSLLSQGASAEVQTALQNALTSLNEAKDLIANQTSSQGDLGKVKVEFYVMSQCPYGTQVEDAIKPVLDKLGDSIDFELNFISTDNGDGTFRSLHGEPETNGNIVQLCAIKYNSENYMDLIVCMNENPAQIPDNWEQCAEDNNLDIESISECYVGEEGKELLRDSIQKTNAAGATGSPTMYFDKELYSGGRQTLDFMRVVCNKLDNHPECKDLPACASDADCTAETGKIGKCQNPGKDNAKCVYTEPEAVGLVVINDQLCDACDVSMLVEQLKLLFKGLDVEEYDFEDTKGREIYDETGVKYLPALLFDDNVENGEGYESVKLYLDETGDYLSLRIGAQYDPLAEQCNNEKDDRDNDGLVDCEDDECKSDMVCREEIPEKLDVFVMSQCPYGTLALNAMEEVLENFEDIDFNIYYIARDNGDGTFQSLHGEAEVNENIRELCAIEYYPEDYKYMDYIWCRNKDITSTAWESCATDNGMDAEKIKECWQGEEGKQLLSDSIKVTNGLGIGASPTWLANNKYLFSGIDAETIKSNYCDYNELDACDTILSGDPEVPSGSC
ncbi:hypothetical protein JW930_01255 [Candidatus Woesearchaeota archaeon]|nr:hypothetical protein [Candidatus Woesearchaeota archaeon]